jgi:hypothetical protein
VFQRLSFLLSETTGAQKTGSYGFKPSMPCRITQHACTAESRCTCFVYLTTPSETTARENTTEGSRPSVGYIVTSGPSSERNQPQTVFLDDLSALFVLLQRSVLHRK